MLQPTIERDLTKGQIIEQLMASCEELEIESRAAIFRIHPTKNETPVYLCKLIIGAAKGSTEANALHALSKKLERQARDDLAIVLQYDDISPRVAEYVQRLNHGLAPSPDFGERTPHFKERIVSPEHYQDLRNLPFFTIDPSGSRDIDDAIAVVDKTLYIAFADVTPLISSWSDPLIHYAGRFGVSLYDFHNHFSLSMLGVAGERASLFQAKERFAWVVKIPLTDKYPEDLNDFEIFRAKIYPHANLTYQTSAEEISDPAVRNSFEDAKKVTLTLEALRLEKNPLTVEKSEYESERLIAVAMVTAKNLIAKFLAAKSKYAFYRVHQPDLKTTDFSSWLKALENSSESEKFNPKHFENPEQLLRLIRRCMHNDEPAVRVVGQEIFNHYVGVATFSLSPEWHNGLKLKPFVDIKALRKFDGLLNQLILESIIYDTRRLPSEVTLKTFLNQLKSSKRDYFANFALLRVYNRHKLRAGEAILSSSSFRRSDISESETETD